MLVGILRKKKAPPRTRRDGPIDAGPTGRAVTDRPALPGGVLPAADQGVSGGPAHHVTGLAKKTARSEQVKPSGREWHEFQQLQARQEGRAHLPVDLCALLPVVPSLVSELLHFTPCRRVRALHAVTAEEGPATSARIQAGARETPDPTTGSWPPEDVMTSLAPGSTVLDEHCPVPGAALGSSQEAGGVQRAAVGGSIDDVLATWAP